MKLLKQILIIYLISYACGQAMTTTTTTGTSTTTTPGTGVALAVLDNLEIGGLFKTCMLSLMESISPPFCWKKGGDAGLIPTGCPAGYFRNLALCYVNCDKGYVFSAGSCWEECPQGYQTILLSCQKGNEILTSYVKKSYIPKSLTNFASEVPCRQGLYKEGALCYRDCNLIGMKNCGIGACSLTTEDCVETILNLAYALVTAIADGFSNLVSGGSAKAIKNGVKDGVEKLGKAGIKKAGTAMKKQLVTEVSKKVVFGKALQKIKNDLKEKFVDEVKGNLVSAFCQTVWDKAANDVDLKVESIGDKVVESLDVFNIGESIKSCSDAGNGGNGAECAKSVMKGLEFFDPTGLMALAGAFIKPTCDESPLWAEPAAMTNPAPAPVTAPASNNGNGVQVNTTNSSIFLSVSVAITILAVILN